MWSNLFLTHLYLDFNLILQGGLKKLLELLAIFFHEASYPSDWYYYFLLSPLDSWHSSHSFGVCCFNSLTVWTDGETQYHVRMSSFLPDHYNSIIKFNIVYVKKNACHVVVDRWYSLSHCFIVCDTRLHIHENIAKQRGAMPNLFPKLRETKSLFVANS